MLTIGNKGPSLGQVELIQLALGILDVLEYLHSRTPPIYYRDIKPSNIIVRSSNAPVLVDFGSVTHGWRPAKEAGSTVTGTFGYMPPEQLLGHVGPTSSSKVALEPTVPMPPMGSDTTVPSSERSGGKTTYRGDGGEPGWMSGQTASRGGIGHESCARASPNWCVDVPAVTVHPGWREQVRINTPRGIDETAAA